MKVVDGEKQFTASVWILTRSAGSRQGKSTPLKMLLVHHKKFNKWLQPGGHIERYENPIEAAVREVREETGLDIGFLMEQVRIIDHEGTFIPTPKYIMEQTIPAYGQEPLHYHIDVQYVIEVDEQELKHREEESHDIGWFSREEILKLPIHEDTRVVVEELM